MWEQLQDIDKKIDKLRERVRRATEPSHASAREMTTIVAQEITCVEDDLSEKYATFYNGSPDSFVLHRLSMSVSRTTATSTRTALDRYAFGYIETANLTVSVFDFTWNYLTSSRQSAYCRQPIGSTIFNGLERSQAFDLYEPLILKPADAIEFHIYPIAYALPGTTTKDTTTTYFVNFLAFGYRRPL